MPDRARQLAAIMFTDIVGYTALMDEDEDKAFALLKKNRSLQNPLIQKHNGRLLKEMGDGILASFTTISDAVYCAGQIQMACEEQSDLSLRIGIHQGEVVFEGEDVFGSGVNIASRIEALASPGEVWVSETIHRNVQNKLGISSEFIREEQLKNVREPLKLFRLTVSSIDRPEETVSPQKISSGISQSLAKRILISATLVLILGLAGYFLYHNLGGSSSEGARQVDRSIAVLPFKNLSADEESQYFADGVMEAILNNLSKIGDLKVISRTSVEQFRGTSKAVPEIAEELGVAHLLEGSAQQYGDKVRITVQLINAAEDKHLWSENYDRELTDIFTTQSEIAKKIAEELEAKLSPKEIEIIESIPTQNLTAWDYYLRGKEYQRQYLDKRQNSDYENALSLFRQSLELDGELAAAYTGMSRIYWARNYFTEFLDDRPLDSVLILTNLALDLDPNHSEAYRIRGRYYIQMKNDEVHGYRDLEKSISLDPNDSEAYLDLARSLFWDNKYEKGYRALAQASNLIRGNQLVELYDAYAWFYLSVGDYSKAEKYMDQVLKLEPDNLSILGSRAHLNRCQNKSKQNLPMAEKILSIAPESPGLYDVAIIHMMNGNYEESEKYFRKLYSLSPDRIMFQGYNDLHMFAYVLMKIGKKEEANQKLNEIKDFMLEVVKLDRRWTKYIGYELAKVYALLGDREEAIKWMRDYLKNGFQAGLQDFALLDPPLESLRDDGEFLEIIKQGQVDVAHNRALIRRLEESEEMKRTMDQ